MNVLFKLAELGELNAVVVVQRRLCSAGCAARVVQRRKIVQLCVVVHGMVMHHGAAIQGCAGCGSLRPA